ncbi:MAG TPA: MFS transporter [Methanotrichaceae archaeon]|nr:MFS transporter [Methanotrichaceae archaeon]HQF15771.1 MFS transporter [Methanotrichaceae archaeon]HQI90555.1 MFS transporter [Methanotrichaceae archaeon]
MIKKNTATIIICNTLIAVGSGLTAPLFVRYLEVLGATPRIIGSIEGINYVLLFATILGGYLADLLGRKKIIVISHAIFSVALLWFVFTNTWIWAIPGIVLLGGRVLSEPAIDALLADETASKERGKIYSLMWILITLASIGSSLGLTYITSLIGLYYGVKFGFTLYFILVILSLCLFYIFLEDNEHKHTPAVNFSKFRDDLSKTMKACSSDYWHFFAYYLAETPARMLLSTYYVLFLVHAASSTDAQAAMVFSIAMIIYLVTQIIVGPLIDKVNRRHALSCMLIATLVTTMLFILSNNLLLVIASCAVMLATIFLEQYMHLIFMADVTANENRGTSLGLMQTIIGMESALSVFVGGFLFEMNPFYPFEIAILFLVFSLFIFNRLVGVKRPLHSP